MTLIYDKYNHKWITEKVHDVQQVKGDIDEVKKDVNQFKNIFKANEITDIKRLDPNSQQYKTMVSKAKSRYIKERKNNIESKRRRAKNLSLRINTRDQAKKVVERSGTLTSLGSFMIERKPTR